MSKLINIIPSCAGIISAVAPLAFWLLNVTPLANIVCGLLFVVQLSLSGLGLASKQDFPKSYDRYLGLGCAFLTSSYGAIGVYALTAGKVALAALFSASVAASIPYVAFGLAGLFLGVSIYRLLNKPNTASAFAVAGAGVGAGAVAFAVAGAGAGAGAGAVAGAGAGAGAGANAGANANANTKSCLPPGTMVFLGLLAAGATALAVAVAL